MRCRRGRWEKLFQGRGGNEEEVVSAGVEKSGHENHKKKPSETAVAEGKTRAAADQVRRRSDKQCKMH